MPQPYDPNKRRKSPDRQPRRPAPSKDQECGNCGGTGYIRFEGRDITCGVCQGKGRI